MFNFEKLEVYQNAVEFAIEVYKLTKRFPKEETYGLINQLRRAAVSISLNIAEGSGRTKKEFKHFLSMSRTSAFECVPLLQISLNQEYISKTEHQEFYEKCETLSRLLNGLIKAILKEKVCEYH